jgi:4-hydroxy-tetrahydrodipicolinate reductase
VIQWSSGNVGKHAIRAVAEREDLELAGLLVLSEAKHGRDAGEIAGVGPLGVAATTSVEAVLATPADVVIHTPLPSLVYGADPGADLDAFCRLLESGKNVITTVGYMYPKVHGEAVMGRLQAACRAGGVSFHGTGANPGWAGDLLPLTLSAMSRRIEQVYTREISNFQAYPSPEIMFDMMGFGKDDAAFQVCLKRMQPWLSGLFRESVQMVADGLGAELDGIEEQSTLAYAPEDLETASGLVRKGTVAGQRWEWAGMRAGRKVVVHETVWRMHDSLSPEWPTGKHSVEIKGDGHMRLDFDWSLIGQDTLMATAMHAVNAIPYVCQAEPGVRTFLDLPLIAGRGAVH